MACIETVIGEQIVYVYDVEFPTLMVMNKGLKDNVGIYAFWTAHCYDGGRVTGRARIGLSAGDRFDRMFYEQRKAETVSDRRAYATMLHDRMGGGKKVDYISPSSLATVKEWVKDHLSDTQTASHLIIGKKMQIVKFKKGGLL